MHYADWFLTADEMGNPERGLPPWSTDNAVTPLVDGSAYFARLVAAVRDLRADDCLFFTDWQGDADELLCPEGPTAAELLGDAARRGVVVKGLMWRSHSQKLSYSEEENRQLGDDVGEAGGEVLLDQRVRRGGSHHQKMVVLRGPGRDAAFVGGIDLCHGRRDDAEHAGDPQAPPLDKRYGPRPPWHDAMVELRGPAVADVLDVFSERWDDPTPLDHRNPWQALLHRKARMPRHPEPLPQRWDPPPPAGPHEVQVLRTYPSKRPRYPFAPDGERSIARAYSRAFARARRLVYVEDQYFWSEIVAAALADALRREPGLQVVAVVPRYPEEDNKVSAPPMLLGQQRARHVLHEAGGDRFAMYDLENLDGTPVYVHAKVCVVDDEWMTCGSDNLNLRSWTHDSELTCAVVDPEGTLPRDVRVALWAEHLGVSADDPRLADLDGAAALWAQQAGQPGSRARPHRTEPVSRLTGLWAYPAYRFFYDPDGRPRGLRGTDRF